MNESCTSIVDLFFMNNTTLHVVQFSQVAMSLVSMATMLYTVLNFRERSLVHVNFRELFLLLYFFFLLHSISVGVLQSVLLFRYYTIKDPCEVPISKLLCYSFRITACVSIMGFVFVYMAMAVERMVATFYRGRYEILGPTIGRSLSVLVLLSSCSLIYLVFSDENYSGKVAYCSGVTEKTAKALKTGYTVLFGFDFVAFAILILLLRYNKHEIEKKSEYELSRIYQLQANVYVISLFLPNLLFHSAAYCVYLLLNLGLQKATSDILTLQLYTAIFYLVPYYTAISPLILLWILRRARVRRQKRLSQLVCPRVDGQPVDEQEFYFKIYADQWHARKPTQDL